MRLPPSEQMPKEGHALRRRALDALALSKSPSRILQIDLKTGSNICRI